MKMEFNRIYPVDEYALVIDRNAKYMEETQYGLKLYIPCKKEKASIDLVFDDDGKFIKERPLMIDSSYYQILYTNHYDKLIELNKDKEKINHQMTIFDYL